MYRSASSRRYAAQEVIVMLDMPYYFPQLMPVIDALVAAVRWRQALPFTV